MKKLVLILSVAFLATACAEIEKMETPNLTGLVAAPTNPNAGEKQGAYKEPAAPVASSEEVDIKRDFPAYHTSPRFDNEPAAK